MHYFESHITIEPVFDERRDEAASIAKLYGFKLAELLMKKRKQDTEERSSKDTFMTSHSKDAYDIISSMRGCINHLRNRNFKVWRYKIEAIMMDSRIEDEMNLLEGSIHGDNPP